MKKTKIVATLGPASDSQETIKHLIESGVNVFRFNMKHATIEWHHERINRVQKIADEMGANVGILIDLQGPEIRIETRDHETIEVKKGDHVRIGVVLSDEASVCIPHEVVFQVLEPGDILLVDDGFFELKVVEVHPNYLIAEAEDDAKLAHRKGMNLPGKHINLPSLIEDDLHKLDMAGKGKVDFVALSFSRTRHDIETLRKEMEVRDVKAKIIAKIESQAAIDHLDDLIESADGVMVARGDLGIEVPIEELAYWQKTIVTKCRRANKPVIVATQMLQSMVDNPRPTRAEATDVANAIFDGTDAIMLSAESASGKYPVRAVKQMAKIAAFTEPKASPSQIDQNPMNQTELLVHAAMTMIDDPRHPDLDKIVIFTESGYTARVFSSLRPKLPIVAVSRRRRTVEQLTLSYGITSHFMEFPGGPCLVHQPNEVFSHLKKIGAIAKEEHVMVIHGVRWQQEGHTSSIALVTVR